MMKHIPNIFTLANLFFGCCAIVFILQSGESLVRVTHVGDIVTYLPEKIWLGSLFIGLAAIMDFLDGFIARLLKVNSNLGIQLDSLSDVVSFGVAPAMIVFQLLRIALTHQFEGLDLHWFWLSPAFLLACFAAYRLGKFNLDTRQSVHFIGMPTPAMALLVASLPLIVWKNYFNLNNFLLQPAVLYGIIVLLCYLMLSEISFLSFKFKKPFLKNKIQLFLIGGTLFLLIFFQWLGIALSWILYVCLSFVQHRFSKKESQPA